MADGASGSTVPRRQLGRHLRELRNKARLTVKAAAEALEWSEAKLWRIETGQTSLRSHDVETMCRVYGAGADLTSALMALAKETKAKGWWHSYGDVIPNWFDVYISLEEAATALSIYQAELVPGLLQTDDYARTVIRTDNPTVSDQEIERRVQLRIERQALLTRVTDPPGIGVVLNEAVIRRPIGSEKIMADQLAHLLDVGELPNLAVRVMPFARGMHYGVMSGPFVMLEFPTNGAGMPNEPTTIYIEGFAGALYLDKPHEVERYELAFNNIKSASLNETASRKFIADAAKEWRQ
ncbi:helix-turn-helix domain-containing protein [Actinacidiphila epipremni]|uniref:Helix-turn-helix domain-containing protein n=1 Tax=Actinacidiphila epipremni TaxID=2053013 RepID=A0ABX0ZP21_9ACTN|nr:helix-turn-helix transcriptional regulator [Actinacidiphila epipremni]NJP45649.1 helix-turn-helix domain-containing protein [Actinacidiphila epipremni]